MIDGMHIQITMPPLTFERKIKTINSWASFTTNNDYCVFSTSQMTKKHHQVNQPVHAYFSISLIFTKNSKLPLVYSHTRKFVTNNRTKWCSSNSLIAGYHGYCGYITIGWSYTIGFHIPDGSNHLMNFHTITGFIIKFHIPNNCYLWWGFCGYSKLAHELANRSIVIQLKVSSYGWLTIMAPKFKWLTLTVTISKSIVAEWIPLRRSPLGRNCGNVV